MIVLSRSELIGYDGYWHIFVARQDDWRSFWEQALATAHPPLLYALVKVATIVFGAGVVAYRLVPMAGALGSTWLLGRIVERTTVQPILPAVAAFAFGSSLTTVTIALDIRSYTLGTFFVLWACLALMDLVEDGLSQAAAHRSRVIFALTCSLALLSHYATALFLVGSVATCAMLSAVDRGYRERLFHDAHGRRPGAMWPLLSSTALAFGVPFALLAIAYAVHIAKWWARSFNHVAAFLFDPQREDALAFVWRTTKALFELYVPVLDYPGFTTTLTVSGAQLTDFAVATLVVVSLAALGWLGFRPPDTERGAPVARRVPPLLLACITALLVILALLGRYPYGGPLRHQFLLFPFALIVLTLLVDEVAARVGRRAGMLVVGLFALAAVFNTVNWVAHFRVTPGYLLQAEMDRFREVVAAPEAIQVDSFNLFVLFMHHHEWRWRFVGRAAPDESLDLWRVEEAGGQGFYVCRDRRQWLLDLSRAATYRRLAACLEATGTERVAVFRPQQRGVAPAWPVAETEGLAQRAAGEAGLVPETLIVDGESVYAAFVRR